MSAEVLSTGLTSNQSFAIGVLQELAQIICGVRTDSKEASMLIELTPEEVETLLTSLQYSRQRIHDAEGTPYSVRQENLVRHDSVVAKLQEVERRYRSEQHRRIDTKPPIFHKKPVLLFPSQRIAGLHPGAISTSEDFNAPIEDEFSTGSE